MFTVAQVFFIYGAPMLRALPALVGLLLLVPVAASAAPFGELPFQPVRGTATCLRATGTPGELVRQSKDAVHFLGASPAGLTAGATLAADGVVGCAETATWPGGGGRHAASSRARSGRRPRRP